MKFIGYVDREVHGWPPPGPAAGIRVEVEVTFETTFEKAAKKVVRTAGFMPKEYFYWPYPLRDGASDDLEYVAFPGVVIADDGEFLWTQGKRSEVTFGDLVRTRDAGLFSGDPFAIYLERASYGDGVLPGWDDFISWTAEFVYIGGVALFLGVVRKAYHRWRDRGARGPLAYLDLIVSRDQWDERDVTAWFGLDLKDARDMLEGLGFERSPEDQQVWAVSAEPRKTELRRRIREDYLHQPPESGDDK